jgi:hypothetical protein
MPMPRGIGILPMFWVHFFAEIVKLFLIRGQRLSLRYWRHATAAYSAAASQRSASMAAAQPWPAAVMAWR